MSRSNYPHSCHMTNGQNIHSLLHGIRLF